MSNMLSNYVFEDAANMPWWYSAKKSIVNKSRKAKDIALNTIIVLVILAGLILLASGHRIFWIASESMVPTLKVHQLVLAEKVDASECSVGDIVTYKDPNRPFTITHRIVAEGQDVFIFKGDNNEKCDAPIDKDWVKYRIVWY